MTLYEQLLKQEAVVENAREEMERLLSVYTKQNCPFKVGDKVEICGYDHSGKTGIVNKAHAHITFKRTGKVVEWFVEGVVLKKDGTPICNRDFYFNETNYINYNERKEALQ